ncbi:hypothetical protein [Vibrio intestinalis]|uniref:hypothetical protein n=1 Tax=Vibrio intestinalis TaxID=2933291 RepID=UPI0021A29671|nr:hypothetical protein [Vibrio intestinalis]
MDNFPPPRHIIRRGNYPYLHKITQDYFYQTHWKLRQPFVSRWLEISCDGMVRVKANQSGYAWDGCTPKYSLLNLAIVGIPDGHIDYRTMKPYTYYASLVHDTLYQYLDSVPVSKQEIDKLFLQMLGDFKLRHLYYWCVRTFGGLGVKQQGLVAEINKEP